MWKRRILLFVIFTLAYLGTFVENGEQIRPEDIEVGNGWKPPKFNPGF